ncbi:hypothetical protein EFR01_43580 [Sinorhizobium fredii]|nr:hypothetical protein EFR01_43580 [Sinorhizobium fredii]
MRRATKLTDSLGGGELSVGAKRFGRRRIASVGYKVVMLHCTKFNPEAHCVEKVL